MLASVSNVLIAPILFFALGAGARAFRSDLRLPPELTKALSIYLLIGIGLHGGAELSRAELGAAMNAVLAALALSIVVPTIAYQTLIRAGRIGRLDAAAVAAHYGSVSAGTFLAGVAWLQAKEIAFESYPLIMLAIMESPAIIIGLLLAQRIRAMPGQRTDATAIARAEVPTGGTTSEPGDPGIANALRTALTHGSVVLLLGSMLIGAVISDKSHAAIDPFFQHIFMGALCLYLLELGMVAMHRLGDFRAVSGFLTVFGILMPIVGGLLGLLVGRFWLGLGVGGTTLVALLGASASYIAVPPAIRMAIPEANPSIYLTLSLGITFPFNVIVGIPLFHGLAARLAA